VERTSLNQDAGSAMPINRVPFADTEHHVEIARLERIIALLDAIPQHRRNVEHAEQRTEIVRAMLEDLRHRGSITESGLPAPWTSWRNSPRR